MLRSARLQKVIAPCLALSVTAISTTTTGCASSPAGLADENRDLAAIALVPVSVSAGMGILTLLGLVGVTAAGLYVATSSDPKVHAMVDAANRLLRGESDLRARSMNPASLLNLEALLATAAGSASSAADPQTLRVLEAIVGLHRREALRESVSVLQQIRLAAPPVDAPGYLASVSMQLDVGRATSRELRLRVLSRTRADAARLAGDLCRRFDGSGTRFQDGYLGLRGACGTVAVEPVARPGRRLVVLAERRGGALIRYPVLPLDAPIAMMTIGELRQEIQGYLDSGTECGKWWAPDGVGFEDIVRQRDAFLNRWGEAFDEDGVLGQLDQLLGLVGLILGGYEGSARATIERFQQEALNMLHVLRGSGELGEDLPCIEHFPSAERFEALIQQVERWLRAQGVGLLGNDEALVPRTSDINRFRFRRFLEWLRPAQSKPPHP